MAANIYRIIFALGISSGIVFGITMAFMSLIGATGSAMGIIGAVTVLASMLIIVPALEVCDLIELKERSEKHHVHLS